jgi:sulfane dehydrogenase subunit SoxC
MKDRRKFLRLGLISGAALTSCSTGEKKPVAAVEDDGPDQLGKAVSAYGERSPFEKTARLVPDTKTPATASSRTPLADMYGTITPNALHFERHHAGVPRLDPGEHKLLIHGMVDRPLVFTLADLKRLPSVSRVHFVECAGNSGGEWGLKNAPDVQRSHGWPVAPLDHVHACCSRGGCRRKRFSSPASARVQDVA